MCPFYASSISLTALNIISSSIYCIPLFAAIINAQLHILLIILGIPFDAFAIASSAFGLNMSIVDFAPASLEAIYARVSSLVSESIL